jgi:hypothetical protein
MVIARRLSACSSIHLRDPQIDQLNQIEPERALFQRRECHSSIQGKDQNIAGASRSCRVAGFAAEGGRRSSFLAGATESIARIGQPSHSASCLRTLRSISE